MTEITFPAASGLYAGDLIEIPLQPLSIWQRFLLWLACPWRWPSKTFTGQFVVTAVTSELTFEIVRD